jgi:hypothetical protein
MPNPKNLPPNGQKAWKKQEAEEQAKTMRVERARAKDSALAESLELEKAQRLAPKPPPSPISLDSEPETYGIAIEYKECPFCAERIIAKAIKCRHCGSMTTQQALPTKPKRSSKQKTSRDDRQTDPFAVVAFISGLISLGVLPLVFTPICYVCCIISYFRLKANPDLKGNGYRIAGALCGMVSMAYLFWLFGFFD